MMRADLPVDKHMSQQAQIHHRVSLVQNRGRWILRRRVLKVDKIGERLGCQSQAVRQTALSNEHTKESDLQMVQKEKYYTVSHSPWFRPILKRKSGALLVHWVFQGLMIMDTTERAFKLGLDLILFALFGSILSYVFPLLVAIPVAIVIAHTINFIFNGQVYAVLKHFGDIQHSWQEFNEEKERLRIQIEQQPAIIYAAAYGSLARDQWSPTSDLDIRLVRAPGLVNGLRVCSFALRERARAFWKGFPLDIFVLDGFEALNQLKEKHTPVVLVAHETNVGDRDTASE
jgi:predicted nucleotidyltransferase